MPRVLDYTTIARVKEHLSESGGGAPVGGADGAWDTLLGRLVTEYSAMFERALGRYSLSSTHTEYFDVEPWQQVWGLRGFPNVTVSSVYNDPDRAWPHGSSARC